MLKELQKHENIIKELKNEIETLKTENEQLKQTDNIMQIPDTVPMMDDTQAKKLLTKPRQTIYYEHNNDLKIAYQRSNGSKTIYSL